MKQVSANVYVEVRDRGANNSLVTTSEGMVMVDTPLMPSDALTWRQEVEAKGKLAYIINTEPHLDHIAGSGFFDAVVVCHEGCRRLFEANVARARDRITAMEPQGLPVWESHLPRPPGITFSERLTIHLGQLTFQLITLPGHTAHQTAVVVPEERIVFTGDNVVYNLHVLMFQGYPFRWLESLKAIESLDVDLIVPGHGGVCSKAYLREEAAFINEWIEAVRQAINRGWSKEEVTEGVSLLDRYPPLPGTPISGPEWMRMNAARLYDILTQGEEAMLQEGR